MGKKGGGKKKKKGPAEPTDPYAGYLALKLKFGLGDSKGLEFMCMFRNRKTEEKYDPPVTVGDLFKELWRQTERNEEFDDGHTGDGRRYVIFGPLVGSKKEETQRQCALIFKGDSEIELEKDLHFKSHDVVTFDSLTNKAWDVMLEKRPMERSDGSGGLLSGWVKLLEDKWYVPAPPVAERGEEEEE